MFEIILIKISEWSRSWTCPASWDDDLRSAASKRSICRPSGLPTEPRSIAKKIFFAKKLFFLEVVDPWSWMQKLIVLEALSPGRGRSSSSQFRKKLLSLWGHQRSIGAGVNEDFISRAFQETKSTKTPAASTRININDSIDICIRIIYTYKCITFFPRPSYPAWTTRPLFIITYFKHF
jgi:hypothetical protein